MTQGRLAGKRILITAAAQGIGRGSAIACAEEGAHVIATDINQEALKTLPAGIETHLLDVCNAAAISSLRDAVGPLDVLFNCAGIVPNGTVLDGTEEEWDLAYDLNVKSMYRMMRAFLPGMLERAKETDAGSVINMASMASSIKGFPNRCAYGTTKAAVIGLTKSVAADFVRKGLRCNAICPGTVDTPSLRQRIAASADPVQAEKDFIARQPIGRLATVAEIVPLVVFLASNESRFVTGQYMLVDGGVTI